MPEAVSVTEAEDEHIVGAGAPVGARRAAYLGVRLVAVEEIAPPEAIWYEVVDGVVARRVSS